MFERERILYKGREEEGKRRRKMRTEFYLREREIERERVFHFTRRTKERIVPYIKDKFKKGRFCLKETNGFWTRAT